VPPISCFARFTRRMRIFRLLYLLAPLFLSSLSVPAALGQSKPQEYQVKPVYLYNFGRFVQWPESVPKTATFPICVLGRDPFGPILDLTIANEAVNEAKLVSRRIETTRDAAGCRILFVSSSEAPHIREILASIEKLSILTVSDMPDFTGSGGMIQFVLQDKKVRFEVNLSPAEKAGLALSSQLLKVAIEVKRDSRIELKNP
jgi:hypothetical protein